MRSLPEACCHTQAAELGEPSALKRCRWALRGLGAGSHLPAAPGWKDSRWVCLKGTRLTLPLPPAFLPSTWP